MVSKKVLKNIGVFAMAAVLVASPALAVSANMGSSVAKVVVHNVHSHSVPSTPTVSGNSTSDNSTSGSSSVSGGSESSASSASSSGVSLVSKAVVTSSGVKLVSTINGAYRTKSVDGAAVITPEAEVLAAFGASNIGAIKLDVLDSVHGPAATTSINYGLAVLAADNVAAVKGPELDLNAFLNGKKVVDINQPVSIAIGIPASFRTAGYDYAAVLVQEGGRVSILPNLSEDPNVVIVNSKGYGVYVLVKAPAGSFDKYK